MTRIKDITLADQLTAQEMGWLEVICPVTSYYFDRTSLENFDG